MGNGEQSFSGASLSFKEHLRNPESDFTPDPGSHWSLVDECKARFQDVMGWRASWQRGVRKNFRPCHEVRPRPSEVGGESVRVGRRTRCPDLTPPPNPLSRGESPHLPAASTAAGLAVALLPLESSGFQSGPPGCVPAGRFKQDSQ